MPDLKQTLTIALVSVIAVAIAKRVPVLKGFLGQANTTPQTGSTVSDSDVLTLEGF